MRSRLPAPSPPRVPMPRVVSFSGSFVFVRGRPPATARPLRRRSWTAPTGRGHNTGVLKIRKVGCSTPPLATSERCKRSSVMICLGHSLTSCPIRLLTLADMARRKQARKDVTGIRIAETHIRCGSIATGP